MGKALTYRQGDGHIPVQTVQEVGELLKVVAEYGVRLVIESVDKEILEEEKLCCADPDDIAQAKTDRGVRLST